MPEMNRLIQAETAPQKPDRNPILETVCAFTDPIIVFPAGGWEHDLPEPLKKRLPLDRLAHVMLAMHGKEDMDECCDTEALLYMYPRTMASPMTEQWTRIYLYLGYKVMGEQVPADVRQGELSKYDMAELRKLKRWIQERKLRARNDRERKGKGQPSPDDAGKGAGSDMEYKQLSYF